jgi:hypothetical protein
MLSSDMITAHGELEEAVICSKAQQLSQGTEKMHEESKSSRSLGGDTPMYLPDTRNYLTAKSARGLAACCRLWISSGLRRID